MDLDGVVVFVVVVAVVLRLVRFYAIDDTDFDVSFAFLKVQIIYQCTWPGCAESRDSCASIEKHVRQIHLGPKDDSESKKLMTIKLGSQNVLE